MTPKRSPVLAILALFVAGGALAGYLHVSGSNGGGEAIPWHVTGIGGANSSAADTSTSDPLVLRVHVEQWPVDIEDDSWLIQSVDEGSDRVTITLRPTDAYRALVEGHGLIGMYDTGGWVSVHLHERLPTCTTLRDGATGTEYHYCSATPQP